MYSDCTVCSCCFFSVTGFDTPLLSIWCSLKFHGRKPKNLLAFWKRKSTPSLPWFHPCSLHFPRFQSSFSHRIQWYISRLVPFVSIRLLPPFFTGTERPLGLPRESAYFQAAVPALSVELTQGGPTAWGWSGHPTYATYHGKLLFLNLNDQGFGRSFAY